MRRSIEHPLMVAAAAVAIFLTAGCGGSGGGSVTVDQANLQTAIEVSIATQKHELSVVECPHGIKAARGVKFTCTATLASGRQIPFAVTGLDDKGNVHYGGFAAVATRPARGTGPAATKLKKK